MTFAQTLLNKKPQLKVSVRVLHIISYFFIPIDVLKDLDCFG